MGGPNSGKIAIKDWATLYAHFKAEYQPHLRTLKEFVAEQPSLEGIPYKTVSAAFIREEKRAKLEAFHARNEPILLAAQRHVAKAVTDPATFATVAGAKHAEFALKVFEKVAEREEPNPLLQQTMNVVVPPLFPQSALAAKAVAALTGKAPARIIEAPASKQKGKP
ncbi:MAG: hypothetical protein KGL39_34950 [Patescibacteria group bacterium]|nr:hypothetical protein [Patescibacteria group bacterium]